MPAKYTKWMIIWKNLTPLDSSQLEVFLEIFWEFFIFLNSNLNFELGRFATGRYRNQSGPVTPVTVVSGPVPVSKKNPVHIWAGRVYSTAAGALSACKCNLFHTYRLVRGKWQQHTPSIPKKKQVILEILKEINKKKDNVCSFFITHIYH